MNGRSRELAYIDNSFQNSNLDSGLAGAYIKMIIKETLELRREIEQARNLLALNITDKLKGLELHDFQKSQIPPEKPTVGMKS